MKAFVWKAPATQPPQGAHLMSDTATSQQSAAQVEQLDPRTLLVDANVRLDIRLDPAFVASIKDLGVLEPIVAVRTAEGAIRVRLGHRRTLAAIEAGRLTVPVVVVADEGTGAAAQIERIIGQYHENTWRTGLTRAEEIAVVATLADLGVTAAQTAKRTKMGRAKVDAARTIAGSELARSAVVRYEFLTLDQAAALAEFEGDAEGLAMLVRAAKDSPGQFDHVAAQLRANRAEREAKAVFTAELDALGIAVYGDRPYVPWTLALENLRDSAGNEITPEAHASCPGRAVTIAYDWAWAPGAEAAYRAAHGLAEDDDLADVEFDTDEAAREAGFTPRWQVGRYLCTDPEQHGHTNVHGTPRETPTQAQRSAEDEAAEGARKSEARRRVIGRNKQWRAATEVRRKHLRDLLAAPRLPKALAGDGGPVARFRAEAIARNETKPEMSSFGHRVAADLLGLGGSAGDSERLILEAIASAAPGRVAVIELAMVLGAAENGCGGADGQDAETWRQAEDGWWARSSRRPQQVRYLAWLAENTGYGLSDIEAEVVASAPARPDDQAEAAQGDVATE